MVHYGVIAFKRNLAAYRIMVESREIKVANIVPFGLRLQPDLKRRVEDAAKVSGNSLNTEIAMRLAASLDADDQRADADQQLAAVRNDVSDLREEVKALRLTVNFLFEQANMLDTE